MNQAWVGKGRMYAAEGPGWNPPSWAEDLVHIVGLVAGSHFVKEPLTACGRDVRNMRESFTKPDGRECGRCIDIILGLGAPAPGGAVGATGRGRE